MKVAIIVDSLNFQKILNVIIKETTQWDVDFFSDASHFGKDAKLKDYSIIITDFYLPGMNGRELIKSISNKTSAQLAIMSSESNWVSDADLEDKKISTIIDKTVPNNIVDALKYLGAKKEISDCMEIESKNQKEIISLANGK